MAAPASGLIGADRCAAAAAERHHRLGLRRKHLCRSTQELFRELLVELKQAYERHAPRDRMQAICLAFVDFWLQRQDDYRAIFMVVDKPQGEHDRYFVDSAQVLQRMDVLRRAIVQAQASGQLRPGDPHAIQNVLLCGVQGIALSLIGMPEFPWGDPDQLKRATVGALVVGLG